MNSLNQQVGLSSKSAEAQIERFFQKYGILGEIVLDALNKTDPCGFMPEAPPDEYLSEAKEICDRILGLIPNLIDGSSTQIYLSVFEFQE